MKRYRVFVRWSGQSKQENLKGSLTLHSSGCYIIEDEDGYKWYFPIGRTVIEEVE